MGINERLKGRKKNDKVSLRHVKFMVAQSGDRPKQLEKKDKILTEKSGLELIIQIRAFEQNEK